MNLERFKAMTGRELRSHTARDGSPLGPSSPMVSIAYSVAASLTKNRDLAVIDAVSEKLGTDEWRVSDLRDRLIFEHRPGGEITAVLDGEPLIRFDGPTILTETNDATKVTTMRGEQKYWKP